MITRPASRRRDTTRRINRDRIRATASGRVDAASEVFIPVYKVPLGYRAEMRRIFIDTGAIAANGSNLYQNQDNPLTIPGTALRYLKSGTLIEWGFPRVADITMGGTGSIPGVQTWDEQEGPLLTGGEVFEVAAILPFAFPGLSVIVKLEGVLSETDSPQ